jgi:hypothetical protein
MANRRVVKKARLVSMKSRVAGLEHMRPRSDRAKFSKSIMALSSWPVDETRIMAWHYRELVPEMEGSASRVSICREHLNIGGVIVIIWRRNSTPASNENGPACPTAEANNRQ